MTNTVEPIEWMITTVVGFCGMIIQILLLMVEYKKRKSNLIIFVTNYLRIGPILCIVSGSLYSFFMATRFFNGFCFVAHYVIVLLIGSQYLSIGFYQLSRLYYCFSQNKVYSDKGYPTCLYIIMFIFGTLLFFSLCIYDFFIKSDQEIKFCCGINEEYQSINNGVRPVTMTARIWAYVLLSCYFLWDFLTLLLYMMKIFSFRKFKSNKQIIVYKRIMSILNRILILTILYEIFTVITIISTNGSKTTKILFYLSFECLSVALSCSMFLMQQHNTNQYRTFLRLLYKLQLHHICCCCFKSIIIYELQLQSAEPTNNADTNYSSSKLDTGDLSIKMVHSDMKQLSVETTVATKNSIISL